MPCSYRGCECPETYDLNADLLGDLADEVCECGHLMGVHLPPLDNFPDGA